MYLEAGAPIKISLVANENKRYNADIHMPKKEAANPKKIPCLFTQIPSPMVLSNTSKLKTKIMRLQMHIPTIPP